MRIPHRYARSKSISPGMPNSTESQPTLPIHKTPLTDPKRMADLLVDEGIGQDLVQQLRARGFRVFHTLEFHPKGSSDALVFVEAQRRKLTIFTWNRDDYMLLAEARSEERRVGKECRC